MFAVAPPAIPGISAAGGFSMMLQDRSGGDVRVPGAERRQVHGRGAASGPSSQACARTSRPPCRSCSPTWTRTKAMKAGRAASSDVYAALQAFLGGAYVNDFTRFGRQWRVFVQAEPSYRTIGRRHRAVLRAQRSAARWCRCRRSCTSRQTSGPEYTVRFNLYRSVEIHRHAGARLQLGPGARRARRGRRKDVCRRRWATPGTRCRIRRRSASGGRCACSGCRWCSCS